MAIMPSWSWIWAALRRRWRGSCAAPRHAAMTPTCSWRSCPRVATVDCSQHRSLRTNVRTSVTHTHFMAGRYLEAAAESERQWQAGNMGATALLCAGHADAAARGKVEADRYGIEDITPAVIARDRNRVRSSLDEIT